MPRCVWRARAIGIVIARLPARTSETFARLPMKGTRSRGLSPSCSIRNSIASTALGYPIGTCRLSYASNQVDQYVELVAFGGSELRVHQLVDTGEGGLVVLLGPDRLDVHLQVLRVIAVLVGYPISS